LDGLKMPLESLDTDPIPLSKICSSVLSSGELAIFWNNCTLDSRHIVGKGLGVVLNTGVWLQRILAAC
jgi:hypothetical protein